MNIQTGRKRMLLLAGIALLGALIFLGAYAAISASYSPVAAGSVVVEPHAATPETPSVGSVVSASTASSATIHTTVTPAQPVVDIDGQHVRVALALTPAEQEKGLGGRAGLGGHEGMLFVFLSDDQHFFWMKDMNFSIDMIWFSSDGTVIYIQPNVSPDTYPAGFGPQAPSRYVLEVPANFAATYGIKIGDSAALPRP